MISIPTSTWREFKAKVIVRFGTVRDAANYFQCTVGALRQAVLGLSCQKVRQKLEDEGLLSQEEEKGA